MLMDLVVNHCSDEHAWFAEGAASDPEGPYGNFFYTTDQVKDGEKLPCNWRSLILAGLYGNVSGETDWYYLHVFHKKQPDLNWENPELQPGDLPE